ncbi:MAG: SHOCT domain-containing protein [Chlorobiaceae bacterium]
MPQIKIKPSKPAALLVLVIAVGMFIAALTTGTIAEAGIFGVVWAGSCIAMIIFVVFAATSKNGITSAVIETDGPIAAESSKDIEARLKKLDALLAKNMISKEEYKRQREKILDAI